MSPAPPIAGPGLYTRRLRVSDRDVVLLRALIEAHDGLAAFYGDGSGVVSLSTPVARAGELDALIVDLQRELSLTPIG